jgi:uncharacterized protein (DUF362 family)
MVREAVMRITGEDGEAEAWGKLFRPSDRVGIKLSCLAGRPLSPRPELADAIVKGLQSAGVKPQNIILWDRSERELRRAGFTIRRKGSGPRCLATDSPGWGYLEEVEESGSVGACWSRIAARWATALISVAILKDHDLAGVSLTLKNFYGAIHNPNKYHDNRCDPYVAQVCSHPYVRDKLRLAVCDAMRAQCHCGPAYRERYAWNCGSILMSTDPVALDRVAADIIEKKRVELKLPSLKEEEREPTHIESAARLGLGRADRKDIQILT